MPSISLYLLSMSGAATVVICLFSPEALFFFLSALTTAISLWAQMITFADCLVFWTVSAVQNMSEISHGNHWWFNIGLHCHSLSAFIRRYAFHLQLGLLKSHTCPLLLTKMMIYVSSANQHGRPRRLLTCSRQYGPTKTWETRWTKQAGPRATSRYLLLWFLAKCRASMHS